MRLLLAMMVGLLLTTSSPSQEKNPPPPKAERDREYAKVELRGQLEVIRHGVFLHVRSDEYRLDLSEQKELKLEDLRKLGAVTVIVTGKLTFHGLGKQAPQVLVSSFQLAGIDQ
jgi:hypothetical protein